MGITAKRRPLWACPRCGHRFVTAHVWHSCSKYDLAHHFDGKKAQIRDVFNAFLAAVRKCGPVTVIPQKTRIAIQARVRFAGGMVRRECFDAGLWLTRQAVHPTLIRVEALGPATFIHRFRLREAAQIDAALRRLIREAYRVGCQKHLDA